MTFNSEGTKEDNSQLLKENEALKAEIQSLKEKIENERALNEKMTKANKEESEKIESLIIDINTKSELIVQLEKEIAELQIPAEN